MTTAYTFIAETHTYRDETGTIVPSVTQVLAQAGLVHYSMAIALDILERKSSLGTAVHLACHQLDTPSLGDLNWASLHEEAVPYVLAYEKMKAEQKFLVRDSEVQGIATVRGFRYGYQIDKRGWLGQKAMILDLKCAVEEKAAWRLQLAGYELVQTPSAAIRDVYEHTKNRIPTGWERAAVILKPDGSYRMCRYRDPRDKDIFLCALAVTTWGRNNGVYETSPAV